VSRKGVKGTPAVLPATGDRLELKNSIEVKHSEEQIDPGLAKPAGKFRPDIEGLRAVAVLAVIGFHADLPFLPGGYVGVDVFFVVSGFLITSKLRREFLETGSVRLGSFYAARAKRLLPSATLVLLAVVVAASLTVGWIEQAQIGADVTAAALFVSNWSFAAQATEYMGAGAGVSPLLNFWSLSLEEQFYFLWPLLILIVGFAWGRRDIRTGARALVVILGMLFVTSLWFSVSMADADASGAYFELQTRVWELAAGALASFGIHRLARVGSRSSAALVCIGLGVIVFSAVLYDSQTLYPGTAALAPVVGATFVILFGVQADPLLPVRLLAARPLQYVGRRSYSLYLWHWPVLVFAGLLAAGADAATRGIGTESAVAPPLAAFLAVLVSFALAAATYRWLEAPLRYSSWLVGRTRVVLLGALGCIAMSCLAASTLGPTSALSAESEQDKSIANQLVALQSNSIRDFSGACFGAYEGPTKVELAECEFGDRGSPVRTLIAGDSHAAMWAPALDKMGQRDGFNVSLASRGSCPWWDAETLDPRNGRSYTACQEWRQNLAEAAQRSGKFSTVFLASTSTYADLSLIVDQQGKVLKGDKAWEYQTQRMTASLRNYLAIADRVVILQQGPKATRAEISGCLSEHLQNPEACVLERRSATAHLEQIMDIETAAIRAADSDRIGLIQTAKVLCPGKGGTCPTVNKEGWIIYQNDPHIVASAAASYADALAPKVERFVARG
jgi:peptidoglycan/LPS O-acetylase OafA/YrhL